MPLRKVLDIDILGKKVPVKNYICSVNGCEYCEKPADKKLELALSPTSFCPGRCPFCIAEGTYQRSEYDLDRLRYILERLNEQKLVRGISFTGGEPFLNVKLLNDSVNTVFDVLGEDVEVCIHTNGINIDRVNEIDKLELVSSIHISRHHYDDSLNRSIFGIDVPNAELLKKTVADVGLERMFVYNCILLRGYIDSSSEIENFMEFSAETGVWKSAFIQCMDVNDFTAKHKISFEEAMNEKNDRFMFIKSYRDFDNCHCQDGLYASKTGELLHFYTRTTAAHDCEYARGLSFNSDNHLRVGYAGEVIC